MRHFKKLKYIVCLYPFSLFWAAYTNRWRLLLILFIILLIGCVIGIHLSDNQIARDRQAFKDKVPFDKDGVKVRRMNGEIILMEGNYWRRMSNVPYDEIRDLL